MKLCFYGFSSLKKKKYSDTAESLFGFVYIEFGQFGVQFGLKKIMFNKLLYPFKHCSLDMDSLIDISIGWYIQHSYKAFKIYS